MGWSGNGPEASAARVVAMVLGALGLSACHAPDVAATRRAEAAPRVRPGLWSQEVAGGRGPAAATTICLDDAVTRSGVLFGAAPRIASACQREIRREGAGWRFASVCRLGGGAQLSSSGLATGDFSSSFAIQSVTSVSGAPLAALDGQHETVLVGRWLGPCPKGMAPGDVRFADGRRLRSRRLRELASAFAGA